MVDSKLVDEITVSYDVANNVEEKLKIFLSVNNEIKQYHLTSPMTAAAEKSPFMPSSAAS